MIEERNSWPFFDFVPLSKVITYMGLCYQCYNNSPKVMNTFQYLIILRRMFPLTSYTDPNLKFFTLETLYS